MSIFNSEHKLAQSLPGHRIKQVHAIPSNHSFDPEGKPMIEAIRLVLDDNTEIKLGNNSGKKYWAINK